jgi:hypothetical protein
LLAIARKELRCTKIDGKGMKSKRRRENPPVTWKGSREAGRGDRHRACGGAPGSNGGGAARVKNRRCSVREEQGPGPFIG